MSEGRGNDFRERARVEADRYGPDPWIFVRELLQNARDAGARSVVIRIEEHGGRTRVHCRDDGEGMGYEHARRYLFSLYASSKEDSSNQVGRFGVGFWSILRFEPERIVIRSSPRDPKHGPAWQVGLDGELQNAERAPALAMSPGTEIILERAGFDPDDERRIYEAAHQNARFLCMRDEPELPLPITINGLRVNEPFVLGSPSSSFRRGHVRGVVGLGSAPRVELFSRGLRVRSAACLDDLLSSAGHTNHSRVRFPELPSGLAPQALLESDGLELLLSRSDARDTRTLRRLVKLGQEELRELVEHQLAQLRPPGIGERVAAMFRRVLGESTWWRAVLGAVTGAALALVIAQLLWPGQLELGLFGERAGADVGANASGSGERGKYSDLRARYHGPQVSELAPEAAEPLQLDYSPATARPYFAAMIVEDVGSTALAQTEIVGTLASVPCTSECVDISLPLSASRGDERSLPIPTGHRLEVESLDLGDGLRPGLLGGLRDEQPVEVLLSRAGEAVLRFPADFDGTLRYRTGPGPAVASPISRALELPRDLRRAARALREYRSIDARVDRAVDLVQARVRYRVDRETARLHAEAIAAGRDFVERTLEIGAGDCDVQNGLLVAVLAEAEVEAHLAVGWVGTAGGVSPWLHAWVEYLDDRGRYRVADATGSSGAAGLGVIPAASEEVRTGTNPQPSVSLGEEGVSVEPSESPSAAAEGEPPPAPPVVDRGERPAPSSAIELPLALRRVLLHPWLPYLALGGGLLGLGLLINSLTRRTARRFDLGEGGDLSSLLQGALAQPAAFRHLPSLFHRRLVPVRGGAAISLNQARALASDGQLYAGREQTELCALARRKVVLLDLDTPEGQTVAASLGAVDLDRWGLRLARGVEAPALTSIATYLRTRGERWRCAAVRGLGGRVATLDLRPLGLDRRIGERLLLLDSDNPWLSEAERLRPARPHAASFALLDHLLDHLDLADERRARLLAPLAAAALRESAALAPPSAAGGADG